MTASLQRLAAAVVATVSATMLLSAPALAHNELLSSDPPDGATVGAPPARVQLTFGEPAKPRFVKVAVTGRDGVSVAQGPHRIAGNRITQPLLPLQAGKYVLAYRVVSVDGHPVQGTVSFTTTQPAQASRTPAGGESAAPTPAATGLPAKTPSSQAKTAETGPPWPAIGLLTLFALSTGVVAAGLFRLDRRRRTMTGEASSSSHCNERDGTR